MRKSGEEQGRPGYKRLGKKVKESEDAVIQDWKKGVQVEKGFQLMGSSAALQVCTWELCQGGKKKLLEVQEENMVHV